MQFRTAGVSGQSGVSSEAAARGSSLCWLGNRAPASIPRALLLLTAGTGALAGETIQNVADLVLVSKINKIKWVIYLEITYLPSALLVVTTGHHSLEN